MSLNCKPGDLARVISNPETVLTGIVDKVIRVTRVAALSPDGTTALWLYEGPMLVCICGCRRSIDGIGDALLRPIRGQAGDDETLAWAGKPAQLDAPVAA